MKNALFAVACTLAAVACGGCGGGESRPPESPTPLVTPTETTTTSATEAERRNEALTAPPATPPPATPAPAPAPTENLDMSPPAKRDTSDITTTPAAPSTQNPGAADKTKDATNTKINDRDRHGALKPTDQGGGKDRDITAAIRKAVMGDGALSFTAKNVKIITVGGKVTLRGPVKTDAEKQLIEAKAKAATGVTEVDNQIEVKK